MKQIIIDRKSFKLKRSDEVFYPVVGYIAEEEGRVYIIGHIQSQSWVWYWVLLEGTIRGKEKPRIAKLSNILKQGINYSLSPFRGNPRCLQAL